MILLQALTSIDYEEALKPGWALNGMTYIVGALISALAVVVAWVFISALNTIKDEIKGLHKRIDTREVEHDELKEKHTDLATRVNIVEKYPTHQIDTQKLAEEMINKMRAASGGGSRFRMD